MDFFKEIPKDILQNLLNESKVVSYKKKEVIFHSRSRTKTVYFVYSGEVMLYNLTKHGNRKVIFILGKGQLLNQSIVSKKPNALFCEAVCPVKVIEIAEESERAIVDVATLQKTNKDIIDTFSTFANHTKNRLIACGDNPNCHSLNTKTPITYYGFNEDNDVIIKNHHVAEDGETFDLYFKDKLFDTFTIPVYGKHMVLNATAAIIMCNIYGISKEQIKNSFKTFKNAKRRFAEEKVGNAIIIDDYAHHPTEISATLDAVKRKYKDRRVVAVFKPNTYSRTKDFTNEFVTALSKADKVYLTEIDCNRERQSDYPGVTSNLIVEKIKGAEIISEDTIDKLKNEKDSVVCFMSCAYVNHLIDAFKEIIK